MSPFETVPGSLLIALMLLAVLVRQHLDGEGLLITGFFCGMAWLNAALVWRRKRMKQLSCSRRVA